MRGDIQPTGIMPIGQEQKKREIAPGNLPESINGKPGYRGFPYEIKELGMYRHG